MTPKASTSRPARRASLDVVCRRDALQDVLKYIKAATSDPHYVGIQIYVDPVALNEAEKTMTSRVTLDVEGIPLKTTLRLTLNQLGLDYVVEDGMREDPRRVHVVELRSVPSHGPLLLGFAGGLLRRLRRTRPTTQEPQGPGRGARKRAGMTAPTQAVHVSVLAVVTGGDQ